MTSAAASLLDINVDELFEQHSVTEIDQIHKQLQTDVEHKKEELRTMVGCVCNLVFLYQATTNLTANI